MSVSNPRLSAINNLAEGDLVEAVQGETVIRGRLVAPRVGRPDLGLVIPLPQVELADTLYIRRYVEVGWTVTVIEKAPQLPTEPGVYEERDFPSCYGGATPLLLDRNGHKWWRGDSQLSDENTKHLTPLRRLEPVSVTAKRVAEEFAAAIITRNDGQVGNTYKVHVATLMEIAETFGATE